MRRARCACGHSYSAHRSCTWKHHERGQCTGWQAAVLVSHPLGEECVEEARPCVCAEYQPAQEAA